MTGTMHFIIGANAADSHTTGLGRQMHDRLGVAAARSVRERFDMKIVADRLLRYLEALR